jgi:class 3 adenylate cyclase/tetratricopeptide (TPR) repeat protein
VQACPSCGEENAEQARFCSACGSALQPEPARAGEERKVVSVLFVDLVGFTARSDRSDPEDVRATLRVYHERLKREIERFGGTLEKFVGDAVMAVFGAPVAHEDDAKRSVLAALRILTAIEEVNEEHPELALAVRGAVNTGEAVVALGARPELGEGFVTGDVVNVASRLQAEAPPGAIVVGEVTHRATGDEVEYEELEPVTVKGKHEPLPIWRAVGLRGSFGVDVQTAAATPLIGRDHELTLLEDLFRRVLAERGPQLVTLAGEPGVGKSRLVQEFLGFVDDLPELVYWRQGRCLPYGEGITFWAFGEIVKSHAGIVENDTPEEASEKLARAVATVVEAPDERDWLRVRLAPLVGLGEQAEAAEREESFAAWTSFVEAIAATDPLVMVIEDLHWADPALLAFIEHLADWASGVPLFVLCTARPELFERKAGWGGGKRNHTAVALSPLSSEETAQLIAALLDQAVLPSETQSALLARAGGNPLYAEEFIRMLVDRGILVRREATWELVAGEDEIPVPETVQALIAARLDTLPPDRKSLLQDASVIGKVFWAGALADMGGLDRATVRDRLHELARKELIRPARRPSIEGEVEYAFWHVLICDVAYGQIPRSGRVAKHRSAAAWIERIGGERVADNAELLAHHYEQALELARASGDDVTELERQALRFLMLAAERALRLDAVKARLYSDRALALTSPGDPERLQVLLFRGRLSVTGWAAGDLSDRMLRDAIEEARAVGDVRAEAEALAWLSRVAWRLGDTTRQLELLEQAVRALEGEPPSRELSIVLTRLASAHGLAGHSEEALPAIERAMPVVEEFGTEFDTSILLQWRGQARMDLGDVQGGFDDLREGLRIALEESPAEAVASAHVNLGDLVWLQDGPAKGQELYETGAELAERRGSGGAGDWSRMQTMWTRYDLGAWDEVLAIREQLRAKRVAQGGEWGTDQLSVLTEIYRCDVLLHRGVADEDALVETILLPRAREIGDGQVVFPVFRVAALGRLAGGDVDGAVALVEEADELLRGFIGYRSLLLAGSVPVCLAAANADLLRSLIDQSTDHVTRNANSVAAALAALPEIEGDHAAAFDAYEDAAGRWAAFPSVLEHGHALAGAGRCLLELGEPSDATSRLREARERYASLGAGPLVSEMDALLERATAKTS